MTRARRRHWSALDLDQCPLRVELRYVIIAWQGVNLQLVQVSKKVALSFALSTEDVDIVVDNATGVTIATLWNLP